MTTPIVCLRQCMKVTFPPVMLQLLEEVVKPSPDIEILAKILAMDPVLTATVLTLANSPYYGSLQKITDLKGKRVSLDEPGSGTLVDAKIILEAYGLSESDIRPEYLKPEQAADRSNAPISRQPSFFWIKHAVDGNG